MVFVRGLRADDAFEFQAFAGHRGFHNVGGLFLGIDFPAIGDEGKIAKIGGVACGVIPAPEFLLPRGALGFSGGERFVVNGRFGKSRAGRGSTPMQISMPLYVGGSRPPGVTPK